MKRLFSLILLVVVISGLIYITHYTLNNKGIRTEVKRRESSAIEKVSSNMTKNNLSEIYNIYLNNERHKVKIEYQLVNKSDKEIGLTLYVYFDGKNALEREVVYSSNYNSVIDLMKDDTISNIIQINEKRFWNLKDDSREYLVIDVGIYGEDSKRLYYILNGSGDILNEEGILKSDTSKIYMIDDDLFENYYDDMTLAKLDNNIIWALEEKTQKKNLNLLENKYYIKDGKLEKELIKTYENVSLKTKAKDSKK